MRQGWVKRIILVMVDSCLCFASIVGSMLLWYGSGNVQAMMWEQLRIYAPCIMGIHLFVFWIGGTYCIFWRLADVGEAFHLMLLGMLACILTLCMRAVFQWGVSPAILISTSVLTVGAVSSSRFVWRLLHGGRLQWYPIYATHGILVVGAGEAGAYAVDRYTAKAQSRKAKIIMVDDNPQKQRLRVHSARVCGTTADIPALVERYHVDEIIIAIPSLKGERFAALVALCNETKCHVRVLGGLEYVTQFESSRASRKMSLQFRELDASDFLSREEVKLDTESIHEYLTDQIILVTGGGGSIGSEICRQVMRFAPKELIIFDIYENDAYALWTELRQIYGEHCAVQVLIGSIRDQPRLEEVFDTFHPDVVFHAAAHKHVPLMETSPAEALKNNVFGTRNLLEVASTHGVKRFVQLSTDKAVNPTSVMGATKRITEMLVQCYAKKTSMECMAVRFGNVLGSHGSVIPLFESQIKAGGPVTVTHPEITRYFMTIAEAAQLVLQAGGLAHNGAIYVLDMGEPVRIVDLAEKLIRAHGYEPGEDMQIVFTGLRDGEKLYEELLMEAERGHMEGTAHDRIAIAPPLDINEAKLLEDLGKLQLATQRNDISVHRALMEVVPTYQMPEKIAKSIFEKTA